MFVWRKRASAAWLAANEAALRELAGQRLAIISRPDRRSVITEIAGSSRRDLERIRTCFGGTIKKLRRDWLKKFSRAQQSRLKIGKRLVIVSSSKSISTSRRRSLLIPAGAAFGTGEHVTTAMSLRLLEQTTRGWGAQGFSLLDLGTGSGILALAAARFGAKRVIAIDHDPIAIATAKENARRNKIDNIDFRVADVRRWKFPKQIDIITANLFGDLLIEILQKMKRAQRLIVSGVLREQEPQLARTLKGNGIALVETRRRGKWIAVLARHPERSRGIPMRKL